MHYRHHFHAGNFADVFKHLLLLGLIESLSRKASPWCYLDTHAGAGDYALDDTAARTGEWHEGVGRLWTATGDDPLLTRYLALLREHNAGGALRRYPGSPWWVARCAREHDRIVACEREPAVAAALAEVMPRLELHRRDGYEAASLLPPRERRGLVLIDPPFERPDEFDAAAGFIESALARFAGGLYALWYPLKNAHAAGRAVRRLARAASRPVLDLQIDIGGRGDGRMHACGLAVVNPPYGFDGMATSTLNAVAPLLGARMQIQTVEAA